MQSLRLLCLAMSIFALGSCSPHPKTHALLEQARSDYRAALNDAQAVMLAPLELKQAGEALEQAREALEQHDSAEKVGLLAALAKHKVAVAQEKARQLAAEQELSRALKERDRSRRKVQT